MMRSSTPLKKEISALVVLMMQLGSGEFGSGHKEAPPLIDTFIVPEMPGYLYALFDYGLTKES
ncbi:hypothetical protein [Lysinibacillus sp. NPDC086135]|uniref:hypothetical protein n=1 Tax=Lysinibacillus sp. NPDC086135 TaxID=3364130 RepID=UPI0037F4E78D